MANFTMGKTIGETLRESKMAFGYPKRKISSPTVMFSFFSLSGVESRSKGNHVAWMPCPIEKVEKIVPTEDALALMREYALHERKTFEEWETEEG